MRYGYQLGTITITESKLQNIKPTPRALINIAPSIYDKISRSNISNQPCLAVLACCLNGIDVSCTVLKPCGSADMPSRGFFDRPVVTAGCKTDRYLSNSLSSLRIVSSLRRNSCSRPTIRLSFIFSSSFFSFKACCNSRKLPIFVPDRLGIQKHPVASAVKGLASVFDPEFIVERPLGLLHSK